MLFRSIKSIVALLSNSTILTEATFLSAINYPDLPESCLFESLSFAKLTGWRRSEVLSLQWP